MIQAGDWVNTWYKQVIVMAWCYSDLHMLGEHATDMSQMMNCAATRAVDTHTYWVQGADDDDDDDDDEPFWCHQWLSHHVSLLTTTQYLTQITNSTHHWKRSQFSSEHISRPWIVTLCWSILLLSILLCNVTCTALVNRICKDNDAQRNMKYTKATSHMCSI